MKNLYALCLLTLIAVFIDVVFFHSRTVSAQAPRIGQVRVQRVAIDGDGRNIHTFDVEGIVVGFSCIREGNPTCFIATNK
jgi:hypothetical protein